MWDKQRINGAAFVGAAHAHVGTGQVHIGLPPPRVSGGGVGGGGDVSSLLSTGGGEAL